MKRGRYLLSPGSVPKWLQHLELCRAKPGAWNPGTPSRCPMWLAGIQALGSSPATFPGVPTRS